MMRRVLAVALPRLLALALFVPPVCAVAAVFLRSQPVQGWPAAEAVTIACAVVTVAAMVMATVRETIRDLGK